MLFIELGVHLDHGLFPCCLLGGCCHLTGLQSVRTLRDLLCDRAQLPRQFQCTASGCGFALCDSPASFSLPFLFSHVFLFAFWIATNACALQTSSSACLPSRVLSPTFQVHGTYTLFRVLTNITKKIAKSQSVGVLVCGALWHSECFSSTPMKLNRNTIMPANSAPTVGA